MLQPQRRIGVENGDYTVVSRNEERPQMAGMERGLEAHVLAS